jgi:virginiamycin B lyase
VTPGNPPVIDEFAMPATFTDPFNITVGPDNQIWVSASNGGGAVVRINPADPTDKQGHGGYGVANPAGIAAGPDGKIWLGDSTNQAVVRIKPADMTEEATSDIPLPGFNVRNLTPGPDGNVWVTEFGGLIARVTPSGTVSPFDPAGGASWDIILGPDGNLWYTVPEGNDSKIGRITPAGELGTQYDVSDVGDQRGITVGPDGALWFSEVKGSPPGHGRNTSRRVRTTRCGSPSWTATGSGASPGSSSRSRVGNSRPRRQMSRLPTSPASGSPARASGSVRAAP